MGAAVLPPGGYSFTSCGSADGSSTSSLFVLPASFVTTCSVPIAPVSGSLWMPTTTSVAGTVGPEDEQAAAAPMNASAASAPLLDRRQRAREAVGPDELGEPPLLLAVAV